MVGTELYDDPFAWAGSDLDLALLTTPRGEPHQHQQQLGLTAGGSTAEGSYQQQRRRQQQQQQQQQLFQNDFINLPTSGASPSQADKYDVGGLQQEMGLDFHNSLEAMSDLIFPPLPSPSTTHRPPQPSLPAQAAPSITQALSVISALQLQVSKLTASHAALQSEVARLTSERDAARVSLSATRNELYTSRQQEKRLRIERDEARTELKGEKATVETLKRERAQGKVTEARLRRERNELGRLLVMGGKNSEGHNKRGPGGIGGGGGNVKRLSRGLGAVGLPSFGKRFEAWGEEEEEEGESGVMEMEHDHGMEDEIFVGGTTSEDSSPLGSASVVSGGGGGDK
ncbi:hypothetical protein QBC43DRAFT_292919 [Cladorrhinum sp. PSN259]|nr:hypothetical protein QBC43DRAFT_292919 [Cladorrhinum sp. PSN259]